ncbi:UDP-N-acetylmuramoyl-L-alanine--D-glutamate ligase [Janthinobacterium sp. GW460P]|uniref:UDP-N-acetylmuramoyl-L-alanine--D-glutamate ligase n=1 Tax=unclassified Janthinobacterium TaxID=2610881 RepID=UPI000A32727F|nr:MULTISPECIES: UDP-N-acetylmuramoyl-L-alanine--D-glutamate ligase [unclassified Janthinobacterium]MCC7704481.1 UDP-N-acetylmuramoyl-L-alanine--D-glutamate ligase [Janthinobacterium sp. GW460P]MCC7709983.1 UDP-N-acetylmuramoyl-L-alanine--D-glutamate ligase [Janthinobacterium sp. GW460W]
MMYDAKTALVLGLGESGLAMALWLARSGACVRVADTREAPERLAALQAAVPQAQFIAGAFTADLLDGVDFVAVSPGLAPSRELAQIAPAAQEKNIPVWGEIELFAQALAALKAERGYAPKVVAITGTNGKTTVTSLVGLLCERAGLATRVAGNISPAALDVLREVLDAEPAPQPVLEGEEVTEPAASTLPQAWILELSSFQLHTTFSLQADAATVLNLSQDHLDWHGDMAAYAKDKARIFGDETVRILNRDDALVMHMADPLAETITFGTGEPAEVDSFGLVNERGIFWLAQAVPSEEVIEKKRRKNDPAPEPVPTMAKKLMPADALKIRGQHNAANALAALALCRAIGLPFAPLLHGLREYQGEPHRVELITAVNDVEYYDDSKGTNVGATVAALSGLGKAFGGAEQRLVLIAGGDGKGQDFSPLAEPVSRYVRAVVLIGRDAPALRAALEPAGVDLIDCATLPEAVKRASSLALAGDAVLLSPACASLDMFKNYAHRAQVFVDAVRDIALENGQDL